MHPYNMEVGMPVTNINNQLLGFIREKGNSGGFTIEDVTFASKEEAREAVKYISALQRGRCYTNMTNHEVRALGYSPPVVNKLKGLL